MGDAGSETPPPAPVPFYLQVVENEDGTLTRPFIPVSPLSAEGENCDVYSKDVPLNPTHKTSLRIFRPNIPPPTGKLPVILYSHGGGFAIFNASTPVYHIFCEGVAAALPALVISLDFRHTPENRLPAAYEDMEEAIHWARAQARDPEAGDPWLASHGDFSRFFLMGGSSGANMAYHAAVRALALELRPIRLVGVILNQPSFGGVERTPSEKRSEEGDIILPLEASDLFWRLALPIGADRDHEFCNPAVKPPSGLSRLPKCFVKGFKGDPLIDRQVVFVRMMEEAGVRVVASLDDEGFHSIEFFVKEKADTLYDEIRRFTDACSVDASAA